uniref:Uncharacterized protein n=1 Tax=Arundo donax TaxID=35708 RepID=A0A0A9HEL9_ARUDO
MFRFLFIIPVLVLATLLKFPILLCCYFLLISVRNLFYCFSCLLFFMSFPYGMSCCMSIVFVLEFRKF